MADLSRSLIQRLRLITTLSLVAGIALAEPRIRPAESSLTDNVVVYTAEVIRNAKTEMVEVMPNPKQIAEITDDEAIVFIEVLNQPKVVPEPGHGFECPACGMG